ncbi:MAG: 2-amino-4-hydroxy-6-hydroxymethyldihydropteridine diphosphokinase [Proteiniphilum sp.]|jgi:2-amino-4-hydroxy-6-hydroxymethyldihydropteridine diphosphokinase|nr:2-amino-4-hydroxy-6-hydroxymethyldihydropteridine diphosphokinase [Proteiniphilum sp.]
MNSEYTIYLALGSNRGDRRKNMEEALSKIEKRIGNITARSTFHQTRPVGFQSENMFINSVCEVVTRISINDLLSITQEIERETGRTHKSKNGEYADRTIDIDLILAGDRVIDTPTLTLPHPRCHTRTFVLDPLCEIAPHLIHPLSGKTVTELRAELEEERNSNQQQKENSKKNPIFVQQNI